MNWNFHQSQNNLYLSSNPNNINSLLWHPSSNTAYPIQQQTTTLSPVNCRFYGSARGCRNGNRCQYNHNNPHLIPFCKYHTTINGCRYSSNCKFRHELNHTQIHQNNINNSQPYPSLDILEPNSNPYENNHEIVMENSKFELKTQSIPIVNELYELCKAPLTDRYINFQYPIKLNHHQFAIVPTKDAEDKESSPYYSDGIYAYDINTNDWNKIMNYPKNITTVRHGAVFHEESNCIYIVNRNRVNTQKSKLLQFDLETQTMTIVLKNVEGFGTYPGLVSLGDEIHIFGVPGTHGIYDCNKNTLIYQKLPEGYAIHRRCVVYLKTKHVILIFAYYTNKIYLYSLSTHKWIEKDIDTKERLTNINIAATCDDKYIIVIHDRRISVLDVDTNVLLRSNIEDECLRYSLKVIVMVDQRKTGLVASGFVRKYFDKLWPLDIVNMIRDWIMYESLYMLEDSMNPCEHKKITLDEIFKNVAI